MTENPAGKDLYVTPYEMTGIILSIYNTIDPVREVF